MLDSFSGPASDLKPKQRTMGNLLAVLAKHPRVSTWDMDDAGGWLWRIIAYAEKRGLLKRADDEPFPWLRYELTEAGRAFVAASNPIPADPVQVNVAATKEPVPKE
jgi:hypothetical protein